jgi:hypothetical protein
MRGVMPKVEPLVADTAQRARLRNRGRAFPPSLSFRFPCCFSEKKKKGTEVNGPSVLIQRSSLISPMRLDAHHHAGRRGPISISGT